MQAKPGAGGKTGKAAPSQQGAAKAKEGQSNAAAAARLLSIGALTAKILEWAPEVWSVAHQPFVSGGLRNDHSNAVLRT